MQNSTQQIEVDIDVQTTKKPSKMFSAGPFGQLKNLQKCFRQIRSDSRKTSKTPGFSHDRAGSQSKRRAGSQSKRRAGSQSKRRAGSQSKRTENFKRPKNREDSSDLDENLTESIAAMRSIISEIFGAARLQKNCFQIFFTRVAV